MTKRYVLESPDGKVYDLNQVLENGRTVRAAQRKVLDDLDAVELSDRVNDQSPGDIIKIGPHKSTNRGNIPTPVSVEGGITDVNLLLVNYTDRDGNQNFVAYDSGDRQHARPAIIYGLDLKTVADSLSLRGVALVVDVGGEGVPIELPTNGGGYQRMMFRLVEEAKRKGEE